MSFPILTFVTFLPAAGAVLLIFVPKEKVGLHRSLALAITLVTFAASLLLYVHFDGASADPQFVEKSGWLGYGINYHLGIDGISLWLVLHHLPHAPRYPVLLDLYSEKGQGISDLHDAP